MKSTVVCLTLILAAGLFFVEVSAQTKTARKKVTRKPESPVATKTRARRAAPPSVSDPAGAKATPTTAPTGVQPDQASSAKPAPEATQAAAASGTASEVKGNEKPSEPEPGHSATPLMGSMVFTAPAVSLRDEINAAPNGQERIRLQLKLVDQLVASGNKADALAELRTVSTSETFDPQGFYNAGNSFARLGDTDGAIEAYRKAIAQRKGKYSRAFNNLGVVLLRAGRWDEAYEALLSALKLENFRYAEASYNLGRLYAERGQTDLAIREWRRTLTVNPEHTAAAQALSGAGNSGRIVVEAQRPKVPGRPVDKPAEVESPVANTMASARPVNIKSSSPSRQPKPLAIDQASFEFLQRARTSSDHGNLPDAIDNYRRLISRQGGYFPPANLELSYALLAAKRYDEALANLLQVANRDGARYPVSYYHLARVYELKGELKLAETSFAQAATAYGAANPQFFLDLCRVREKQGDFKGALEAMERYLSVMQGQGQIPAWSDERLAALRQKASTTAK